MMWIFRRQWAMNERLPFPLAQIETALIAPPRQGRLLNDLLGSRLFWTALLLVLAIQSSVALNRYFPRNIPLIPLKYNISTIMGDEPWNHFSDYVKSGTIFFTFIGIAYFIQTRVSFTLWATYLLAQIATVQQRMYQSDIPYAAWRDQHLGAHPRLRRRPSSGSAGPTRRCLPPAHRPARQYLPHPHRKLPHPRHSLSPGHLRHGLLAPLPSGPVVGHAHDPRHGYPLPPGHRPLRRRNRPCPSSVPTSPPTRCT